MSISIVIPTWNRWELLQACLDSIEACPPTGDFEVVVVDNGSTDGTREGLQVQPRPWLRLLRNVDNLGFAVACNQGAAAARHDVTMFLNNDTVVTAGFADAHVQLLELDPRIGVAGSRIDYPDGRIQHAGVLLVDERNAGDPLLAVHRHHGMEPAGLPDIDSRMIYSAVTAACCSVRTWQFRALGGFDERFANGYEDIDLCLRFREVGFDVVYEPASRVVHLESRSGYTRALSVRANVVRFHRRWLGSVPADVVKEGDQVTALPTLRMRPWLPSEPGGRGPSAPAFGSHRPTPAPLVLAGQAAGSPRITTPVTVAVVAGLGDTVDLNGLRAATAGVEVDWLILDQGAGLGTSDVPEGGRLVEVAPPERLSGAGNVALQLGRGSHLLLLAAGTRLPAGGLADLLAAAGSAGIAGPAAAGGLDGQALDVWLDPLAYGPDLDATSRAAKSLFGSSSNPARSLDLRVALLRRDVVKECGGLPVRMSRGAAQRELADRLRRAGHGAALVPGVVAELPGSAIPVGDLRAGVRPDAGGTAFELDVAALRGCSVAFLGVFLGGRDRAWLDEIAGFPVAILDRRVGDGSPRAASSMVLRAMAELCHAPPRHLVVVGECARDSMHDVQVASARRADAEPHLIAQLRRHIAVHAGVPFRWLSPRRPMMDRWGRPERGPVAIGRLDDHLGGPVRTQFSPGSGPVFLVDGASLARRPRAEYLALADHIQETPGADAAMDALWDTWFR